MDIGTSADLVSIRSMTNHVQAFTQIAHSTQRNSTQLNSTQLKHGMRRLRTVSCHKNKAQSGYMQTAFIVIAVVVAHAGASSSLLPRRVQNTSNCNHQSESTTGWHACPFSSCFSFMGI